MEIDKNPDFAFEKKIGLSECLYGNKEGIFIAIERLMACMKETNKMHNASCEFFRLDFRQPYLDETFQFPLGCLILHLQWGSKKELEEGASDGN